MAPTPTDGARHVRYEPDERPPPALVIALALQFGLPTVASIVVVPTVIVRAAGAGDAFLSWATFAALLMGGAITILQAVRVGRVGAGYILLTGASNASIAVCVPALAEGGPALLATLVAVSALLQFVIAARLSLLRRVFTPAVSGAVIMLIPVAVMPALARLVTEVPAGSTLFAALATAAVTAAVTVAVALFVAGIWRVWAPVIGIAAGCAVAAAVGIYDFSSIAEADWVGLPAGSWPGVDLGFGRTFWLLLPAFLFVALAETVKTVGDGVAIQQVSWRERRAVDFRAIQGAINANGVGGMLSGLLGTMPSVTYSMVVPIISITGVAARGVGVAAGGIVIALAFLPKLMALIVATPAPVVGAYIAVLMAMLFGVGLRMIVNDAADYKGVVAGIAFCVGVGFQSRLIFADYIGPGSSGMLGNGVVTGGLAAILMTLFLQLVKTRTRRIRASLSVDSYPKIDAFLAEFSASRGWSDDMADRLRAVGEEVLITLTGRKDDEGATEPRRLVLTAGSIGRAGGGSAELEFIAANDVTNIEDRLGLLGSHVTGEQVDRDISLRLLRHLASSVRHQQYHDTDVVTVRVEPPASS